MTQEDFEAHQLRRLAQYDRLAAEARELYDERNRQYRDSARTLGVIGVLYEFNGIAGRLRALRNEILRLNFSTYAEGADSVAYSQLEDKLRDAINYGLMALIMLEDGNVLGEG